MIGDLAALQQLTAGALIFATNFALVTGLAAAGAAVTERAGVLNLGHEGVMLLGAAMGFTAAFYTGSGWLGLIGGIAAGLLLGLVKATWSVLLKTEQVINGLMLVPLGVGLSNVLFEHQFSRLAVPPQVPLTGAVAIPVLQAIPVLGPAFFNRSPLAYAAVVFVAAIAYFLYRTRVGLAIRAAGESPETLEFSGLSIDRYRFAAVLIGTATTGAAGALLAVDQLHLFHPAMTAGRGWLAIAIVIVAGWRPWRCLLIALLFGGIDMLQFQFQIQSAPLPYELLLSLPYLATVGVLALRRSRVRPPAALGTPHLKP